VPIHKCFKFNTFSKKGIVLLPFYTSLHYLINNCINLSFIYISLTLFCFFLFSGKIVLHFFVFSFFILAISLFYLDDFKLSDIKILKCLQIIFFSLGLFILLNNIYNNIIYTDIVNYVKDNNNNPDLHAHGHVTVDKQAGKAIGQGLSTIGSQIGLGATMVGISGAVGKTLAKSNIPPLQKAGFLLGSGLVAGLGHSWISSINRNATKAESASTNSTSSANASTDISSNVTKFIDSSNISPLQEFLQIGEIMSYTCLGLIYLLIIQLLFKLHFSNKIYLNLYKLTGSFINNKLEFYLNKIIKLNKQMSVI
jgi:hypothetical protein